MEVKFDGLNRLQVTATTAEEATVLMSLAYGSQPTAEPKKSGRGIYDRSKMNKTPKKQRAVRYKKECPVEGCDKKTKSLGVHLHKAHGIHPDGSIHDSFDFGNAHKPVKAPVKSDGNGGFTLKERATNFLGNAFREGSVIN